MKNIFKKYMNNKLKLQKWQIICIICLIISISGCLGWFYEFVFYFFNGGMKEFYWQGGNFLPWINIYAIGGILIVLSTYRIKDKPILVFIVSSIVTGMLEYFSGYMIYKLGNGLRYWDYNTEILNFGNINGFICFRSILCFGLSALLLMYVILPYCIYLCKKMNKKTILILSISMCSIFLVDEFYNLIFTKIFNLPSALEIYRNIGFNFMD